VHPQEALLQAARAAQQTAAGREQLRERVVVEHRLARLGQLGVGQARYRGRQKSRFQLLVLAMLANLRWTWNWQRAQAASIRAATVAARGSGAGAPWAPLRRRFCAHSDPRLGLADGSAHALRFTHSIAGFRPCF
jgi:hypothetical protein